MDEELVNRCECVHKTFEQLQCYSDLAEAQRETACGSECEGCLPYLKLMFASGETAFDVDDPRLEDHQ